MCADRVMLNRGHGCHKDFTNSFSVYPACYSAFRRGIVISAMLYRSPDSSDCAFILSDATCPVVTPSLAGGGLGSAFSPAAATCCRFLCETKQVSVHSFGSFFLFSFRLVCVPYIYILYSIDNNNKKKRKSVTVTRLSRDCHVTSFIDCFY